ncbi:MAG TPA: DUF4835 family protein [Bacteroidales bacterium]|nr:DUF4835 family protein [Bacteroidales bacterium]
MKTTALILALLTSTLLLQAQELDCRIQVNYSKLQGTSYQQIFSTFQQSMYEFINNTNWTNNVFQKDERIECNFNFNLTEQVSSDEYKGTLQITYSRPVFGTSYNTPILNHLDNDIQFKYTEFEPFEFNPNSHTSNLMSIVAYYIYIIIGMDYDTFGNGSGTEYYQKAERIVQNAQSAPEKGWKAYENLKNRYWLVENLLNDQYAPIRDFLYVYHRQGMDKMADKPADARARIEEALENLKTVHRRKQGTFLMQIITTAKGDEIVNIFQESFPDEKARVYNIMKEIDPANVTKYDGMMQEPKN